MQKDFAASRGEPFPIKMFLIYVLFYAGQAMYNVYLNLFLDQNGFSKTQLGLLSSVSTRSGTALVGRFERQVEK